MTLADRFGRRETPYLCSTCGFLLRLVVPSNMLTCDNPVCDADPMFLIPSEPA